MRKFSFLLAAVAALMLVAAPATADRAQFQSYDLQLGAAIVDGTPVAADGTTAPGIATTDNVPALVWADNEVTPAAWSFYLDRDFPAEKVVWEANVSSSSATAAGISWDVYINRDDAAFDAAAVTQASVSFSGTTTSNTTVKFRPDSSLKGALTGGGWVTFRLYPTSAGDGTVELKGLRYFREK